jgi:cytochrome P450
MANRAERMQASWGDGSEIDIARSMMALTLEIVTETLFGSDVSEESAAMGNAVTDANRYISARVFSVFRPPEWLPTLARHRNRAAIASLDQTVYRIIDSRRRSGDARSDLLSILLSLDGGADGALTDREVRDEVMTLLFAGHETTANALGWTWLLLARNPGIATSMRDQIDQVLGGRTPTAEDLPNLPIVLQVFKETLRLYPPVYGVGRIATRPVAVGGYELPAGTTVGINTWGLHHREDLFPESSRFDPSRFERDRERALPPSSYLPFGDGPRVCIGNQFALVEGHVLLATLAQRVELEVAREEVVPEPLVTLRQHNGMPVRVRVRPSVTS